MNITRRTACQTLLAASLAAQQPRPLRKPNLVVILADDLGYGDIACFGGTEVSTPEIDSLTASGTKFTDGYVSCAVCSPSRASLLTGRYQQRFGHEFNPHSEKWEAEAGFGLSPKEKILPQYLKAFGYKSGIVGKWHLGSQPGFHPLDRGFHEFYGFLGGANDYATLETRDARGLRGEEGDEIPQVRRHPILRGKQEVREPRYLTDAFMEESCAFIDRYRQQPFFLFLALNAVHNPLHATERYWNRFAGVKNERRRILAAMAAAMDDATGAVLRKIRECGLERDTLVVFLSDNGSPLMNGAGSNGVFNGAKCTYYEGGIRIPFLAAWPGRIPAGKVYRHPVTSRDILPTFLAAAGASPPADVRFDGVDLLPFLNGARTQPPHDVLHWRAGKGRAARMGKWKLVECGDRHSKLYDLSADPGETRDLSAEFPAVHQQLRQAWNGWNSRMMPPRWPARQRKIAINGEQLVWDL
jgi:arylsulfatase A-like enzyme